MSSNVEISTIDESSESFYSARSVSCILSEQTVFMSDVSNHSSIESGECNDLDNSPNKSCTHWMNNGLKVVFSNVDCLTSKLHEIKYAVSTEKADVYAFCEIKPKWTNTPLGDTQIQIPDYTLVTNLSREGGRGIAVYIRSSLKVGSIDINSDYEPYIEQVWISVLLPCGPFYIGCMYRSPSSPSLESSLLAMSTSIDIKMKLRGNIIIVGDFNLPNIQWVNGFGFSENSLIRPFLECLFNHSLYQAVNFPTRYRNSQNPSLLDLLLAKDQESIISIKPLPPFGASDHIVISCSFRLYPQRLEFTKHVYTDYSLIRQELTQCDWSFIENTDVEESWTTMKRILLKAIENHSSTKWKRKPKTLPYITKEIKMARNRKKKYWKLYTKNQNQADYYTKYKQARNKLRSLSRNITEKYEESVAAATKTNPKKFWRYVSSGKPGRHSVTQLVQDGSKICDPREIANALNKQFISVFTVADNAPLPDPPQYEIQKSMPPINITKVDVETRLKKINPNKSTGPDGVPPRLLKETYAVLSHPLTLLFQKSLNTKSIPQDWKEAYITPVHKGSSRDEASNYRPISLTSGVGKLLEGIVNSAIIEHLNANKLLSPSQHGFRPSRSVDTNLIDAYEHVTELMDTGSPVDMILLDLAKAFDKVCHRRLNSKLHAIGLHDEVINWTMQFLTNRKQVVRVFGDGGSIFFSESADVESGVPQGTVLGPTLFNIYINDASSIIKNKICLYADDSKIIGPIYDPQSTKDIQADLDALSTWAKTWRLEFNIQKCKVIHFGANNPLSQYFMESNCGFKQPLTTSHCEKDLGVLVDNKLKFNLHTQSAVAKANQTLGIIKRTFCSRSPAVITKLLKGLIRPKLEFGMSIATPVNKLDQSILESVQRRATKCIRGFQNLPYSTRLQRLKIPSLTYRRKRGDVLMTFKLICNHDIIPDLFQLDSSSRTRGHPLKLYRKRANTRLRNKFFSNRVVGLWNSLSQNAVMSPNTEAFKSAVDRDWCSKPWRTVWDAPDELSHHHH